MGAQQLAEQQAFLREVMKTAIMREFCDFLLQQSEHVCWAQWAGGHSGHTMQCGHGAGMGAHRARLVAWKPPRRLVIRLHLWLQAGAFWQGPVPTLPRAQSMELPILLPTVWGGAGCWGISNNRKSREAG